MKITWQSKTASVTLALVLLATHLVATTANSQELTDKKIVLDQTVIEQIAPHVPRQVAVPMPSLSTTYSTVAKGNFGRAIYIDELVQMRQLENGLYEIEGNSSGVRNSGSKGHGTSLSLCGLVTLLSSSASRNVISASGFIGASNSIIEMKFSSDSTNTSRIVNFKSSTSSVCNIVPGASFSFQIDGRSNLYMKRQFLSDKNMEFTNISTNDCTASISTKPASNIAAFLTGNYIEVACVATDAKGQKSSSSRAYLLDYHYYLTLATKSNSATSEITYSKYSPATLQ